MNNEKITSREVDFAKWYTDVVKAAKLADYTNIKGFIVMEPNGYAIWENMQKVLDSMFKETGHTNVYLPAFIPESLLKKESELIEGFAPEVAWITHGGSKELEERLAFRPTSESMFSDYYSNKVKSYKDLPILYNQWCNIVRWEKETRPFLRGREFLWQEGHTCHSTETEAKEETMRMLETYKSFYENYLAIPVLSGKKTEKEKFAGAEFTLTIEALMQNGICLQAGTSHYFGQKFSKAYDIKFVNKENNYEYVYQTSWGVSTRMIAALIMAHSDDKGLVLPPKIAPKQVCVTTIKNDEELLNISYKIEESLNEKGIRTYVDSSDRSAGYKFAESEVNGIPVRIEVGPREMENGSVTVVRRDTLTKEVVKLNNLFDYVNELLKNIQESLYNKAKANLIDRTYECDSLEKIKEIMDTKPGIVNAYWCGEEECELKMKEIKGTKSRCILETRDYDSEKCIVCGKKAKSKVALGIQY